MSREDLWKEFDKEVEMYKFYLEIVLKTSIFVFGITGAITSYCLANVTQSLIKFSLLLPLVMNAGFACMFWIAAGFA